MVSFWNFLRGKKTYFVAAIMVVTAGLYMRGYIDEVTFKALEGLLTGAGLAALRNAK
jgi:hypothetical protein